MPTIKDRINLSVPPDLTRVLEKVALRDRMSVSAKALELVQIALELEEDLALTAIVNTRSKHRVRLLTHKQVWG